MQHLEEGVIHAWLDGELPPGEREAVEAHVASCDECKAAVAEARGFIAGSSRILMALDAVPGGVLPTSTSTPSARAPKRFTISRAWMAAAAVLVLSTATVIAVRPRRDAVALRVAEAGKEEKKSVAATPSAHASAMKADTQVVATRAQAAPLPASAPAEKRAMNAPAPKPADELAERSREPADKMSARNEALRKDVRAPARTTDSSPMMVADATPAAQGSATASVAAPQVAGHAAPMVAQAPAPAPPRFGDSATERPMALNSVVVSGAGTMAAVGKLDAAMASDSAAPKLLSRSAAAIAGDTVVTSVYLVSGASVTLIDRSAGRSELRREAQLAPRDKPVAKTSESAARLNSLTWTDSTGRTRTLRGEVSRVELERVKAALFGATP
jgi:hypothetical protein